MRFLCRSITLLMVSFVLAGCTVQKKEPDSSSRVCFSTICFGVEIADEDPERVRGLMFRESIPEGSGMLFVFEQSDTYQFRMKNTLISLDMLRLDGSGVVVHIESAVPPCTADPCPGYGPTTGEAVYVLELNSGVALKNNIDVGASSEIIY